MTRIPASTVCPDCGDTGFVEVDGEQVLCEHPSHIPGYLAKKGETCPDCGGSGFFKIYTPLGGSELVACENVVHNKERLIRLAEISNLAPEDLSRRLTDINSNPGNEKMLRAARQIIDKPYGWLYIWGGPGNAKTEALIAIVNETNIVGNGPAMYVALAHLVNWVREAFRDGAPDSYTDRFERILKIRCIAIDEMDKARDTDFSDEFRFHFLDERYRQAIRGETVTVFAGNTDPALLPGPIYDRVRDGRFRVVENTAPSARPKMRRPERTNHK